MTWANDVANGRVDGAEREKLIVKRDKLVKELEDLGLRPSGKSAASARFDAEDKMKLAAKIVAIDKKLGRNP